LLQLVVELDVLEGIGSSAQRIIAEGGDELVVVVSLDGSRPSPEHGHMEGSNLAGAVPDLAHVVLKGINLGRCAGVAVEGLGRQVRLELRIHPSEASTSIVARGVTEPRAEQLVVVLHL